MAAISLVGVGKAFPDGTVAVVDVDLEVLDGELMVLVGPSGSGKTTVLRMIAGLEEITSGELRIGDRLVNRVPARDRDVAMVFQNYALYPHLTVRENIGFGLSLRKTPKDEIKRRVDEAAELLGIQELLARKPRALSGGQRQRVAMGRAIVREPEAFLMDEPLSNLDAKLRVQMRAEVLGLQRELGTTTVYVTHDQVEAMTMGDRVGVLDKGRLQQVDAPKALYERPVNAFVAGFIGSPAMNMLDAELDLHAEGGPILEIGSNRLRLPASLRADRPAVTGWDGRRVLVGIRPERLEDAALAPDHPPDQRLRAKVTLVEALGAESLVHVQVEGVDTADREVVARFGPRSDVTAGEVIELAVGTEHFHFFDPDGGAAVGDLRPTT